MGVREFRILSHHGIERRDMKRKIVFQIEIEGKQNSELVEAEFEWDGVTDIMRDAIKALKDKMSQDHPELEYHPMRRTYQVSYWWWKDNNTTI
jgi:hypothetical protein